MYVIEATTHLTYQESGREEQLLGILWLKLK